MSVTINRVYTRTGDGGTSRLAGGQIVDKDAARLEAYGTIDELNAVLGVLVESMVEAGHAVTRGHLIRIQNELFDLGGELATLPEDRHPAQALVGDADVARLEAEMDAANETLPTLRSFVLPGGGPSAAFFHQARTVCRRAERRLVSLHRAEAQREVTLHYLNRLSDWLFVMGRLAVVEAGRAERLWRPGNREEG